VLPAKFKRNTKERDTNQTAIPDRNQFLIAQIRGGLPAGFHCRHLVIFSFTITFTMFRKERRCNNKPPISSNTCTPSFNTCQTSAGCQFWLKRKRKLFKTKVIEYISVIQNENQKLEKHVEEILKGSSPANNHHLSEAVYMHTVDHKYSTGIITVSKG